MRRDISLGCRITQELMPLLMILGAVMSLGTGLGAPSILAIVTVHVLIFYWFYTLRGNSLERADVRFLVVPTVVLYTLSTTNYDQYPMMYDQAYHLQISNRILERWDWEPFHQGLAYSFRPELVPGLAAIELFWTGETFNVDYIPILLLCASGWAVHNLADSFVSERLGFLAAITFLLLPVIVEYGPSMMLDVAVSGMIISVLFMLKKSNLQCKHYFIILGILSACLGLTKYPYFYIGPLIILILFVEKRRLQAKYTLFGYIGISGLFLIKNLVKTSDPIGPMKSQIDGTIASVNNEITGSTYTFDDFVNGFVSEWPEALLVVAILGHFILIKEDRSFLKYSWIILLPGILLHGVILDFGWVRYSTPWLALACVGIPATISYVSTSMEVDLQKRSLSTVFVCLIILVSTAEMVVQDSDEQELVEYRSERYWEYLSLHIQAGAVLPDDSVVLTGTDITFGLYASTESYRYEDPADPINHAIGKFGATHVYTDSKFYRYDIDVNYTFLYGSPIEPYMSFESDYNSGYLWAVNDSRFENISRWLDSPIEIIGNGQSHGDFALLMGNSTLNIQDDFRIYRIAEFDGDMDLEGLFEGIAGNADDERILCESVEQCSEIERLERLSTIWAVWVV